MAKHGMKSGGGTGGNGTIVSRTSRTGTSSSGGNARASQHSVANDGRGAGGGTQYSRSLSTKPSGNSGTIGSAQPLKSAAAVKYEPTLNGAATHKTTKPQR